MMSSRRPNRSLTAPGRRARLALVAPLPRLDGDGAHEATLDPSSGAAGAPTPTEREAVYLGELRRGGPPPGWGAARAREWGLNPATVARELAAAREVLEESRTPDAAQVTAHELVAQSVDHWNEADALMRAAPPDPTDPAVVAAHAIAATERVKRLKIVAEGKIKSALALLAVHRKPAPPWSSPGQGASPGQGLGAALKSGG